MLENNDLLTFEALTAEQRATAWAVVRSIATALWGGLVAMVAASLYLVQTQPDAAWSAVVPLVGTACLAAMMEVKSRDLEKPPAA